MQKLLVIFISIERRYNVDKKPNYYCNVAQILENSAFDFKIGFGVKKDANRPINEEDIDFYLHTSPQHLKSLVLLLTEHLKIYEKLFGVVNNPHLTAAPFEVGAWGSVRR